MKKQALIKSWTDFTIIKPKNFDVLYDVHIEMTELKTAVVRDCRYTKNGFEQIDSKEVLDEKVIAYKVAKSSY